MYRTQIDQYFAEHTDDLVNDICRLIHIQSGPSTDACRAALRRRTGCRPSCGSGHCLRHGIQDPQL